MDLPVLADINSLKIVDTSVVVDYSGGVGVIYDSHYIYMVHVRPGTSSPFFHEMDIAAHRGATAYSYVLCIAMLFDERAPRRYICQRWVIEREIDRLMLLRAARSGINRFVTQVVL